jgi:hypothetical protein
MQKRHEHNRPARSPLFRWEPRASPAHPLGMDGAPEWMRRAAPEWMGYPEKWVAHLNASVLVGKEGAAGLS